MFDIISAIVSTALGFISHRKQAEAKKKQAAEVRAKAERDAEAARKKAREEAARRRVNYANSGVLFDGTPDAVLNERQQAYDAQINATLEHGETAASAYEDAADDITARSLVNAGGGLISIDDKDAGAAFQKQGNALLSYF